MNRFLSLAFSCVLLLSVLSCGKEDKKPVPAASSSSKSDGELLHERGLSEYRKKPGERHPDYSKGRWSVMGNDTILIPDTLGVRMKWTNSKSIKPRDVIIYSDKIIDAETGEVIEKTIKSGKVKR